MNIKICTKCKITKPAIEFHKNANSCDGLQQYCKSCRSAASAIYFAANTEKEKARCAAYRAANPEKNRLRIAAYYSENKTKESIRKAIFYSNNKEKVLAQHVAYRAANKDKIKEYHMEYRKNNQEALRIIKQKRRARECFAIGTLSKGLFDKLFKLQRGKCPVCKSALSDIKPRSPKDHIVALVNGGTNEDCNIQLLCQPCNNQKHIKDPIIFMQSKGFLL